MRVILPGVGGAVQDAANRRKEHLVSWSPRLIRVDRGPEIATLRLGHPVVDDYLEFVGARGRPNTWLATAFDLKVFFSVVTKDPADVTGVPQDEWTSEAAPRWAS